MSTFDDRIIEAVQAQLAEETGPNSFVSGFVLLTRLTGEHEEFCLMTTMEGQSMFVTAGLLHAGVAGQFIKAEFGGEESTG